MAKELSELRLSAGRFESEANDAQITLETYKDKLNELQKDMEEQKAHMEELKKTQAREKEEEKEKRKQEMLNDMMSKIDMVSRVDGARADCRAARWIHLRRSFTSCSKTSTQRALSPARYEIHSELISRRITISCETCKTACAPHKRMRICKRSVEPKWKRLSHSATLLTRSC